MIKVLKPGLETTVQDQGRYGYYSIAFPPSGAMDKYSYTLANLLVGNDENAAALEITYLGPELEFQEDVSIAITGAQMQPKINGNPIAMWENVKVKAGDKLSFDFIKSGARVYLAVSGGIDVPVFMGSRSTYLISGLGGFEGRPLKKDDILKTGDMQKKIVKQGNCVPDEFIPEFSKFHEIRMIFGLCSYRFAEESQQNFVNIEWTVTPDANRIGYRLKGERLHFVPREQPFGAGSNPSNVIDNWYPVGSIQVPDGIEPIILMRDAVTAGGFVTLGTVISADLNRMAQVKSNEKVHFLPATLDEALEARRQTQEKILKLKSMI